MLNDVQSDILVDTQWRADHIDSPNIQINKVEYELITD